jgi:aspartyl-tRNA(Asn)/glutamyl-tRNA(Gln) amidotransferase subunit A
MASDDELAWLSASDGATAIRTGAISPRELIEAVLARIEALDTATGAFVTVTAESALADADRLGVEARSGGLRGPLHGVPVAVKDIVDISGLATTCSSRVRAGHRAAADATIVERLRAAGAVIVGKTHTHEFAYGGICPATRNAWDQDRIAGGSSGGSAVALAQGMAALAVGTDTGGSIRIPSAYNGVVGLKPTYGRVPKAGVVPLNWSLDHVGPMARSVEDAAMMLGAMAGRDRRDVTSAREPVDDYLADLCRGTRGLRLGVPSNYFFDAVEPDVRERFEEAVQRLTERGTVRVDVRVPDIELAPGVFLGVLLSEASAFHQGLLRAMGDHYGDDVRGWLELGETQLGTHYVNAQRARARIKHGFRGCFEDHRLDALLIPTVPMVAPRVGAESLLFPGGVEQPIMASLLNASGPFNLSGQPVLSVPCGMSSQGLPVGLAIAGRPFDERTVLRIGAEYERAAPWAHDRPPPPARAARLA